MSRLLYVEDLSVSFDGFKALDIDFFEVAEHELRVVIGPNGAGKTTFMDVLCGKTKPDTGKAELREADLTEMTEEDIVELGVGRKFQAPSVFPTLTVEDNLLLSLKGPRGVWAALFHRKTESVHAKLLKVAQTVGLENELSRLAGSLSHGQKQWLEIGMVLALEPELLLIDEPAAGMTDEETRKTAALLKDLAKTRSVIVIEHDMEFVRALDAEVTVLCEGRILTHGTLDKVQSNPEVIEKYLGRGSFRKPPGEPSSKEKSNA